MAVLANDVENVDSRFTHIKIDVLLSLVRTKAVGHVRDIRRLVVALSRARLGLYIFGRLKLFQNCHELEPAFKRLVQRPTKLWIRMGEMYPNTTRLVGGDEDEEDKEEDKEEETKGKKGKKAPKKKAAKKGKDAKKEKEGAEEGMGKDHEIESIAQIGEYVFGMMKEQQQFAIQQQNEYLKSLQPPSEDAEEAEGQEATERDEEGSAAGAMDVDKE